MTTKRETIMQAILAKLAAVPGITGAYRSREEALSREESPAIVLMWVSDSPRELVVNYQDTVLDVRVGVYARATTVAPLLAADQVADPIVQAVHATIMSDPSLAGLAIDTSIGSSSLELDDADATAAWVTLSYLVWYRHNRSDLAA